MLRVSAVLIARVVSAPGGRTLVLAQEPGADRATVRVVPRELS